jgi:hypothetical protein
LKNIVNRCKTIGDTGRLCTIGKPAVFGFPFKLLNGFVEGVNFYCGISKNINLE